MTSTNNSMNIDCSTVNVRVTKILQFNSNNNKNVHNVTVWNNDRTKFNYYKNKFRFLFVMFRSILTKTVN